MGKGGVVLCFRGVASVFLVWLPVFISAQKQLTELRNRPSAPNLVEQVLLLLDGMDGGKMDLHLGHHFHSPRVFFRSVEKRHIDLADIHPRAAQGQRA